MAKLIPGKLRIEGVELYEAGKIQIIKEENHRLYARVAEAEIRYSLDDELVFCACDFFQKRGFCVHLAALEHYLKNDHLGQELLQKLENGQEKKEEVETQVTFGGRFLESIKATNSPKIYQLAAQGQVESGTNRIIWTLRVGLIQTQKFYVIRDIPLFLKVLENSKPYMIGKLYEASLKLSQFDETSQFVLNFLQGIVEDEAENALFFQNQGRHLYFPLSFFEQGVSLLMDLDKFRAIIIFSFKTWMDKQDYLPLISKKIQTTMKWKSLSGNESIFFIKGGFYLPKECFTSCRESRQDCWRN